MTPCLIPSDCYLILFINLRSLTVAHAGTYKEFPTYSGPANCTQIKVLHASGDTYQEARTVILEILRNSAGLSEIVYHFLDL